MSLDTYPSTIEFHVTMSRGGIPSNILSASRPCRAWRRARASCPCKLRRRPYHRTRVVSFTSSRQSRRHQAARRRWNL
jgi:hypothetical protein